MIKLSKIMLFIALLAPVTSSLQAIDSEDIKGYARMGMGIGSICLGVYTARLAYKNHSSFKRVDEKTSTENLFRTPRDLARASNFKQRRDYCIYASATLMSVGIYGISASLKNFK